MVASPNIVPGDDKNPTAAQLRTLQQQIAAVGNKTLYSISVVNANGQTLFAIQPSGFVDASENPLTSVTINDPISGNPILKQTPATTVTNPDGTIQGTAWFWRMNDSAGNRLIATDGLAGTGLALPYIPVPMYPTWNGLGSGGSPGSYSQIAASAITTETTMWVGRLGYVSHPAVSVDGFWGHASGSTSTVTYKLYVNSSMAGSWTHTPADGLVEEKHTFSCASLVSDTDIEIHLTAQASVTSTDQLACQVLGAFLRQTPAVFG